MAEYLWRDETARGDGSDQKWKVVGMGWKSNIMNAARICFSNRNEVKNSNPMIHKLGVKQTLPGRSWRIARGLSFGMKAIQPGTIALSMVLCTQLKSEFSSHRVSQNCASKLGSF